MDECLPDDKEIREQGDVGWNRRKDSVAFNRLKPEIGQAQCRIRGADAQPLQIGALVCHRQHTVRHLGLHRFGLRNRDLKTHAVRTRTVPDCRGDVEHAARVGFRRGPDNRAASGVNLHAGRGRSQRKGQRRLARIAHDRFQVAFHPGKEVGQRLWGSNVEGDFLDRLVAPACAIGVGLLISLVVTAATTTSDHHRHENEQANHRDRTPEFRSHRYLQFAVSGRDARVWTTRDGAAAER